MSWKGSSSQQDDESPHSFAMDLVHSNFEKDDERHIIKDDIVGYVIADILWQNYYTSLLPIGKNGYIITTEDTCGAKFTYEINGVDAEFLGMGDLHDSKYDSLGATYHVSAFDQTLNYTKADGSPSLCL